MSGLKKSSIPRQSSYNSLYNNPLTELKHNRTCSEGGGTNVVPLGVHIGRNRVTGFDNKENAVPSKTEKSSNVDKENAVPSNGFGVVTKEFPNGKSNLKDRVLKPSSLQLCMQMNEPDSNLKPKIWEHIDSDNTNSGNIWDYSDSEAAPASSWTTLPNRSLLYRPLPVDIGRCTCVIVKEASPEGLDGGTLFALYTNGSHLNSVTKHTKQPLAVVNFMPTIATLMGSYRSIKAWIPKHQSMQLKNTTQMQHINGLPKDWEEKMDKVHQLFSRVPHYNNVTKQYELDFRDRGRAGLRIQSSVKNFQLTLENGRQTILQLGRVGKSKYVIDYRYPLTGYQAFCICLAAIDSKLCCTM
ncbi:unnamed protein product [Ilex paraguariensis]|uniref:Tubby C-terminal domain-containing protein n=1 Tax=Ilex paraguariensis TaxID=185542 RepID=A0ABC8QTZ2_9AQUA